MSSSSDQLPLTPDEVRAAVEAIGRSPGFARSPRLIEFLRYVCDKALAGQGDQINEYLIGVEVFGRGAGYNPAEDAVVRRHAHTLRQKLLRYYAEEGAKSPLLIELPVGTYVPSVQRRAAAAATVAVPARPRVWRWALLGAVCALPLGAGAHAWWTAPGARPVPPLWSRFVQERAPVTIVFSNPATAVVRHLPEPPGRASFGGVPLQPGSPEDARFRRFFSYPDGGAVYLWPDGVQGKLGEAYAGVRLAALLSAHDVPVQTTQARLTNWEQLRRDSVVVLGNVETNPWIERLLERQPLRLLPATATEPRRIVEDGGRVYTNRYPPGVTTSDDGDVGVIEQYALISMLPGLEPRRQMLIVAGLNSQATDLAVELLTERGSELQRALEAQARPGPWHFQAVIRAEVQDRQPTRATVVTIRVR